MHSYTHPFILFIHNHKTDVFKIVWRFFFLFVLCSTVKANTASLLPNNSQLYLELVINGVPTHHVAQVNYRDGQYYIALADLKKLPVLDGHWGNANNNQEVAISQIKGVTVTYENKYQRLLIEVPAQWLPEQRLESALKQYPPQSSSGLLISYDIYANKVRHQSGNASMWNELRFFGDYGTISNTGVYRQFFSDGGKGSYTRYDTQWKWSDEKRMTTVRVGDYITQPLAWSNAVRLGGAQISRNFTLRPDIITYPLPEFSGEVSVPSTVEMFVEGHRYQENMLEPGPFTLVNTPYINGAGEAVIVTKDALGRTVSTTVPFYVSSDLLRKDFTDYTASFGVMRQRYGQKNFRYGKPAFDASYRYGLSDWITLELHTEMHPSLRLAGVGLVTKLGQLGILNTAHTQTRFNGQTGSQTTLGYQYTGRRFNVAAQHTWRNKHYRDLSSIDSSYGLSRQSTQITATFPLQQFGTFSTGYFSILDQDRTRTNLINLNWNRSFGKWGSFLISANYSNRDRQWTGVVQWVFSLDSGRGNVSTSVQKNSDKEWAYGVNYSYSAPSYGGWGWDLGYKYVSHGDNYQNASANWRNDVLKAQGGVYGAQHDRTYWANVSGSLVWMDDAFFASNQINDAFVIVSTDGVKDVPVYYENSLVGRSNRKGYYLVPWAPAYYGAKYEIDALHLPVTYSAPVVEQHVAVRSGSGYMLRFPVKRIFAVTATLVDEKNEHLPIGSLVTTSSGKNAYVGWDGLTYLEDVQGNNQLTVLLPEGQRCHAQFTMEQETTKEEIPHVEALVCKKE